MSVGSSPVGGLDYVASKGVIPEGAATFFESVDASAGQRLVVFGWAMAEALASGKLFK
jgi:hypothetical protein